MICELSERLPICVKGATAEFWEVIGIPPDLRNAPFYAWKSGTLYGEPGVGKSRRAAGRLKAVVRRTCHADDGKLPQPHDGVTVVADENNPHVWREIHPGGYGFRRLWYPDIPVRFIHVPSLVQACRKKYEDSFALIEIASRASYGVLDDLGAFKSSEFVVNDVLFSIIESRVANQLPTIVTCNMTPDELKAISPRMASRIAAFGPQQLIDGPDFRARYETEVNPPEVDDEKPASAPPARSKPAELPPDPEAHRRTVQKLREKIGRVQL